MSFNLPFLCIRALLKINTRKYDYVTYITMHCLVLSTVKHTRWGVPRYACYKWAFLKYSTTINTQYKQQTCRQVLCTSVTAHDCCTRHTWRSRLYSYVRKYARCHFFLYTAYGLLHKSNWKNYTFPGIIHRMCVDITTNQRWHSDKL